MADLKEMLADRSWLLLILVALIVAGAVAFWWWRRRRETKAPSLSRQLEEVYEPYFSRLPHDVRSLPSAIVFGESGSGKSHLIEQCLDFRTVEANRFLPTARDNHLLQLYAGSTVLAQEISWAVLNDVTPAAESALQRLWSRLGPGPVIVVVTLAAPAFRDSSPEALSALAQRLRGKLNILTQKLGREVDLRICLTFMDQVYGYVQSAGVGFRGPLRPAREAEDASYSGSLAPLEDYLPWTLASRSSGDFRSVVSFLTSTPRLLQRVDAFVRELSGGAWSYRPRELHLSSFIAADRMGEPFAIDPATYDAAVAKERRVYLVRSLVAAALLCAFAAGTTSWHRARVEAAEEAIAELAFAASESPAWSSAMAALDAMEGSSKLWLAYTFEERKRLAKERFVAYARRAHLIPKLGSRDKTKRLYAAAVLYARPGSALAKVVTGDPSGSLIEGRLEMPPGLVESYLRCVDAEEVRSLEIEELAADEAGTRARQNHEDAAGWGKLLRQLDGHYVAGIIAADDLAKLKASPVLADLTWQKADRDLVEAVVQAARADGVGTKLQRWFADPQMSAWVIANYDSLQELSSAIKGATMPEPPAEGFGIGMLLSELGKITASPVPDVTGSWSFVYDQTIYELSRSTFFTLLRRGQSQVWIDAFSKKHAADKSMMFFERGDDVGFPPEGAMVGTTQGPTVTIEGYFTRRAYEARVQSAMPSFDATVDAAPMLDTSRARLAAFVRAGLTAYAQRYRGELTRYYDSFRFSVRSSADLRFEVQQIAATGSWFSAFLRAVTENAALDPKNDPYLQIVSDALSAFLPIVNAMEEQKGVYPNIQKYAAILSSAAKGGGGEGEGDLASKLTPVGAAALASLTGGGSSVQEVNGWTTEMGIFGTLAAPFMKPAEQIDSLGRAEIAGVIAASWKEKLQPSLAPVLDRFPFARKSRRGADPEELEALVGANGTFWEEFARATAPIVSESNGRFSIRREIAAPAGMLKTVNGLSRLRSSLWDSKGNRRALELRVAPTLLPQGEVDGLSATMAYLKVGDGAIYAFNQLPSERTVAIEWWRQAPASVVIEMTSASGGKARERSLESFAPAWAFHHLLNEAKTAGTEVTWRVPMNDKGTTSKEITFSISPDPWTPFAVR